jgi:hypothetical protein
LNVESGRDFIFFGNLLQFSPADDVVNVGKALGSALLDWMTIQKCF